MDGLTAVPYRFFGGALINAHNVISARAPSLNAYSWNPLRPGA